MDVKSESETLMLKDSDLAGLYKKIGVSTRVSEKLKEEIVGTDDISADEATRLVLRFIEVEVENTLLFSDAMAMEIELSNNDEFKKMRKDDYDATIEPAREAEAVLADASCGDYRRVKNFINERGNYAINLGNDEMFGRRLLAIATLVPENGVPFKPSMPAWMNEKFNGELDHYSDK